MTELFLWAIALATIAWQFYTGGWWKQKTDSDKIAALTREYISCSGKNKKLRCELLRAEADKVLIETIDAARATADAIRYGGNNDVIAEKIKTQEDCAKQYAALSTRYWLVSGS